VHYKLLLLLLLNNDFITSHVRIFECHNNSKQFTDFVVSLKHTESYQMNQ